MRKDSMTSGARYHLVATSEVSLANGEGLTFGHEALVLVGKGGLSASGKAKVADFEITVGIEQQVGRL